MEELENVSESFQEIIWDVPLPKERNANGGVDKVALKESIPHFDPTLSYEVTKYRPITMTQGLDFKIEWFNEAGSMFDKQGKFNNFAPTSRACRDYWKEEMIRCVDGYECNGYRLTGDNYFFINFYTMLSVDMDKAGEARPDVRPSFIAKQYEFFHYIEICEYVGKDVISFKARGVGFSEIVSSLCVRRYTTSPNSLSIVSAHTENFMSKTVGKMWKQLDWLNDNTQGGMKRLRGKVDQEFHKRASMVKGGSDNTESGMRSAIQGVTADKENKLRGDRVALLIFEEGGSDPILKGKYTQAEALVDFAGTRIGIRVVIGTGGDKGPYLAGLQDMYLNPKAYKGLLYKHNYTESGEYAYTGFFIAAHCFRFDCMDDRGVCDEVRAKMLYQKQRDEYGTDIEGLRMHKAEFCFYAEEALILQGSNDFNQNGLAQQAAEIKIHKSVKRPEKGFFLPIYASGKTHSMKNLIGVAWKPDLDGHVEIGEHPVLGEDKQAVQNLYVAGIDSIDHGVDDSTVGDNGSKFCIVVKKRMFGNSGNYYVCKYLHRPKDVRAAYAQALMIMWYYNCKGNLEDTKIGFRSWLRAAFLDKRFLMRRPSYALDINGRKRGGQTLWGTQASEKMIRHGLSLIKEFTYDAPQTIVFLDMIEQLLKYSYEAKTVFDIVAAMGLCEIGDEDMYNKRPVEETTATTAWQDFGYYTDENGAKRFGPIPQSNMTVTMNHNFGRSYLESDDADVLKVL